VKRALLRGRAELFPRHRRINVALQSEDPGRTSALWILLPIGLWLFAMACYVIWMYARRYRPNAERNT
jgi:hypothetical protein